MREHLQLVRDGILQIMTSPMPHRSGALSEQRCLLVSRNSSNMGGRAS
jgi:hypothetical protein